MNRNHKSHQWSKVLDSLQGQVTEVLFDACFLNSQGILKADGSLTILLPPTANIETMKTPQLNIALRRAVIPVYGERPIRYQPSFSALPSPVPLLTNRDIEDEFTSLMAQERAKQDVISFKRIFVEMCQGDTLAGLVLSNLVFWHTPNKEGKIKLRIYKDGHYWVARTREEWQEETTLKPRQLDRIINKLVELGLVVKANYLFNGLKMMHMRIDKANYIDAYYKALRKCDRSHRTVKSVSPNGEMSFTKR